MFELVMAAMAAGQGLSPTLKRANPDVLFKFERRSVKLECKRVFSPKRVGDNIESAIAQLGKCVNPADGDIGLVAICISRLAHRVMSTGLQLRENRPKRGYA